MIAKSSINFLNWIECRVQVIAYIYICIYVPYAYIYVSRHEHDGVATPISSCPLLHVCTNSHTVGPSCSQVHHADMTHIHNSGWSCTLPVDATPEAWKEWKKSIIQAKHRTHARHENPQTWGDTPVMVYPVIIAEHHFESARDEAKKVMDMYNTIIEESNLVPASTSTIESFDYLHTALGKATRKTQEAAQAFVDAAAAAVQISAARNGRAVAYAEECVEAYEEDKRTLAVAVKAKNETRR